MDIGGQNFTAERGFDNRAFCYPGTAVLNRRFQLGGQGKGFVFFGHVNISGKILVHIAGAVKVHSADCADAAAGKDEAFPPGDCLAVIGLHGMGIVYDFHKVDQAVIMDFHGPAHAVGDGGAHAEGMGDSGQPAGFMNPF